MILGASALGGVEIGGIRHAAPPATTSYSYDLHGNLVKKTLPNGETVTQSFDALNRVTALNGQKPAAGGLLYGYAYRYDLAGNVIFIREEYPGDGVREITQSYDLAHRLTTEIYEGSGGFPDSAHNRIVRYEYDLADNRTARSVYALETREGYTYNARNQLTARTGDEGAVSYEYDHNGNRMTRVASGGVTGYGYDYEQRLVAVTNESLEPVYAYTYDYRTRRVRIEATAESPAPGTTTLSFSGGTSVQEYGESTLNVEYIRGSDLGGGIGGILYTIRGGDPSFTHYNSRGDVVAKTDPGSTLTYQAAYEAYGTRTEEAGSTLDRQKANTKDEDPTGLLNEGFRYRDLETGVFITRDPAGFVDGPNLYTYVRQNPWTKFDPEGLNEVIVSGGIDTTSPRGMSNLIRRQLRKVGFQGMTHDVKWSNFIDAAETNILARQKAGDTQKIEWHVQRSTYETRAVNDGLSKDAYTKQVEQFAKDNNVDLRWFNTSKQLIKNINTNDDWKPRAGDEKISDYTHYSHGYPGRMLVDFDGDKDHSITAQDIAKYVERAAFQGTSKSDLFPCNSATQVKDESVKEVWQAITGSTTKGVVGRMDYGGPGGSWDPAPTAAGAHWDPAPPAKPGKHENGTDDSPFKWM